MRSDKCFDASCAEYGRTAETLAHNTVDFHSHILPGMDDGATDVGTSLTMLETAFKQGIRAMVATSHFYADRESPESFLERRDAAVKALIEGGYAPGKLHPQIYLGAEVAFFSGMSASPRLSSLCIGGGKGILVEMPFERWTDNVISEVLAIRDALGLRPIIAHIERYISYQKSSSLGRLIEGGAIIQSNAEYFTEKKTSKKAVKLLLRGGIHLLGSDAHGLTERVPNLGEGIGVIAKHKFGEQLMVDIVECSRYVLKHAKPVEAVEVAPV